MKRVFAKLVKHGSGYGLNVLVFDPKARRVEQVTTGSGGQEAEYSDMRYEPESLRLSFVVGGKIEVMHMHEADERTLELIRQPDNWRNLCHGLNIRSEKTVAWLNKRGIYG